MQFVQNLLYPVVMVLKTVLKTIFTWCFLFSEGTARQHWHEMASLSAYSCSMLTIVEQGVNFEHISHLALVFLLLTLNM